jgi:hypothetical protein
MVERAAKRQLDARQVSMLAILGQAAISEGRTRLLVGLKMQRKEDCPCLFWQSRVSSGPGRRRR